MDAHAQGHLEGRHRHRDAAHAPWSRLKAVAHTLVLREFFAAR
jgi:hypothetical protein